MPATLDSRFRGKDEIWDIVPAVRSGANYPAANDTQAAANASTSASVVFHPNDTRIVRAATSGSTPIAANTALVFMLPEEQALPCDTAKPIISNRITCAVADMPGIAIAWI